MTSKLTPLLRAVTRDRRVTQQEWDGLVPRAQQTPPVASAEARELLAVWADDTLSLDEGVRQELAGFLMSRGYDIGRLPYGADANTRVRLAIERNVTEQDEAFEAVSRRAGRSTETQAVAVIDMGFDLTHPALADNLWQNPGELPGDGIDNDGNQKVDDVFGWDFADADADPSSADSRGHGAHVMGIATRGSERVDGMALRLPQLPTPQHMVDAIDHAVANGARVVNMSFKVWTVEEVAAVKEAMARHPEVLFVKSAGNDGLDLRTLGQYGYPPERFLPSNVIPNMAVVTASDGRDGGHFESTNWGAPFATHAALGQDVLSLRPGGFWAISGTSQATPAVSNLAAKLLILDDGLTPEDLKALMSETSGQSPDWTDKVQAGGPVNPARAYELAALTGLVRRGSSPDAAAAQLGLSPETTAQLLPRVSRYVRPSAA